MKTEVLEHLNRAKDFLGASEALLERGYASVAAGRAYYAMFHAATAALLARGIERSSHHALISSFGQFLVKTGKVDERFHVYLREAFTLRSDSDYLPAPTITAQEAQAVIEKAREFIDMCAPLCEEED